MRRTVGLGESTWMDGRCANLKLGSWGIPPTPRDDRLESGVAAGRDVDTLLELLVRRSDINCPICVALVLLPADSVEVVAS
jgi:hypothetical protein